MMTSITPPTNVNQEQSANILSQPYETMNTNDYMISNETNPVPNQNTVDENTIPTLPDDKKEELYKKYETFDSQVNNEYDMDLHQQEQDEGNHLYDYENDIKIENNEEDNNIPNNNNNNNNIMSNDNNFRMNIPQVKLQPKPIGMGGKIKKFSFNNNNSEINKNVPNLNKYVTTPILNNNLINNNVSDSGRGNDTERYQSEISNLRAQIASLQSKIDLLNREVTAEKSKNDLLSQKNKELINKVNSIAPSQTLIDIINYLGVQSEEEVIPKLEEIISHLKTNDNNHNGNNLYNGESKIRDELIEKLKTLYVALTGADKNEEIDIKTIWRWIKHLINTVRDLAQEKEKKMEIIQELNEANMYKEYCYDIMDNCNIKSFIELKEFLNNLIMSNQ